MGAVRRLLLAAVVIAGTVVVIAPPAFALDTSPPTISGSIIPAPNGFGWNNGPVTVHFTCNDDIGVASCTPDQAVAAQGITAVQGQAVDTSGNDTETTVTVKIDTAGPIVRVTQNPPGRPEYADGPVTVHATCADELSGVAVCPADQVVNAEGSTLVNMLGTDKASNNTNVAYTVKIDTLAPSIVPNFAGTLGDNGYYKTNVTVSYVCNDAGSGIRKCQQPKTVSQDGVLTLKAVAVDNVARQTTIDVPLKVDRTLPKGKINAPRRNRLAPGGTITGTASDGVSGVAAVTVSFDGGPPTAVALVCNAGNKSCTWSVAGPVALGSHSMRVTVKDGAGNVFVSSPTNFTVAV